MNVEFILRLHRGGRGSFESPLADTRRWTYESPTKSSTDGQPDLLAGWMDGWMKWTMGGGGRRRDEEQDTGWVVGGGGEGSGQVGEVKAGRVHPSSPIGQSDQRGLCGFEALKWTEFQHGHGDCSTSFVGHFGEMVLKADGAAHARNAPSCS
ncbi:hypothetical protein EYF80_018416 [Liparis tanakae]|uniref:Uncharacterized protein n=1 Tax=Liparis tanakae TaxID=230148 RepID=A0A4Z2I0C4_9TELE|nr:hypothetical protein EYF80_018416 [Liparis tanakae]